MRQDSDAEELGLPLEKIEETGVMLPVVSVECRYKVPAKLGDTLKVVSINQRGSKGKACDKE